MAKFDDGFYPSNTFSFDVVCALCNTAIGGRAKHVGNKPYHGKCANQVKAEEKPHPLVGKRVTWLYKLTSASARQRYAGEVIAVNKGRALVEYVGKDGVKHQGWAGFDALIRDDGKAVEDP